MRTRFMLLSVLCAALTLISLAGCAAKKAKQAQASPETQAKEVAATSGPAERSYAVGDTGPAGGLVFYDKGEFSDGWRYLEAAPSDLSEGIQWYNGNYVDTGATATGIGSGKANTGMIVSKQEEGNYAAALCADLELGGYDDWFLPSKDELDLMYKNLQKNGRGGFASAWYWGSSEYGNGYAWIQHFRGGGQNSGTKGTGYHVRAVRAF